MLCKEIIFVNPYSAKKKSIQRSALWQKIAENLNSVKDPCFIVEKRSVRDHIAILIQRFKRQHAQELRIEIKYDLQIACFHATVSTVMSFTQRVPIKPIL